VHGLWTLRWPQCRCFSSTPVACQKKTPRPRRIGPRPPVHQLDSRPATPLSRSVLSRRLWQNHFSSSTRIENVSATTPLRFTPQRRRRSRRPTVVGGLFEGVAEPE